MTATPHPVDAWNNWAPMSRIKDGPWEEWWPIYPTDRPGTRRPHTAEWDDLSPTVWFDSSLPVEPPIPGLPWIQTHDGIRIRNDLPSRLQWARRRRQNPDVQVVPA